MKKQALFLVLASLLSGAISYFGGLSLFKASIVTIFSFSIFGSLFFWDFRLGFMFVGNAIYLAIGAVNAEDFVRFASLDVILFLISMMIVVAMMKEAGLFEWLITLLLRIRNLTGQKLFLVLMVSSAVFSSLMGEVASIMVVMMTVFAVADLLEVDPVPLVISAIIATNIGSAGTVLGNPVGVLIATRGHLSFEDFLKYALTNSTVNLLFVILVLMVWYRKYTVELTKKLKIYTDNKAFLQLITIPSDRKTRISIGIFCMTIFSLALHKRLELLLGLQENTLLLMFPMLSAGIVLLYRHEKARYYVEHEIEWLSILFFMFLFAQAGVIQATGIAGTLAHKILNVAAANENILLGIILFGSGILSSLLDNVVAVAAYIPLIKEMELIIGENPNLWWALLFGACYGGNITMIGSTANIVALGLMEKELNITMTFRRWLRIGLTVGFFSLILTYFMMLFSGLY